MAKVKKLPNFRQISRLATNGRQGTSRKTMLVLAKYFLTSILFLFWFLGPEQFKDKFYDEIFIYKWMSILTFVQYWSQNPYDVYLYAAKLRKVHFSIDILDCDPTIIRWLMIVG